MSDPKGPQTMPNPGSLRAISPIGLAAILLAFSASAGVYENEFLRIMPMGDSNTQGAIVFEDGMTQTGTHRGGYRARLHHRIRAELGGFANFVGKFNESYADQDAVPDHDHDGYGGARIDEIRDGYDFWDPNGRQYFSLEDRLNAYRPAAVLLTAGTNDISQEYELLPDGDRPGIVGRYTELIDRIMALSPGTHVIVGALIPRNDGPKLTWTKQFNAAMQPIIEARQNQGKPIQWVDLHSPLLPWVPGDFSGVHPDGIGYDKMGDIFFGALSSVWETLSNPVTGPGGSIRVKEWLTDEFFNPFAISSGSLNAAGAATLLEVIASNFQGTGHPETALNDGNMDNQVVTELGTPPWVLTYVLDDSVNVNGYEIVSIEIIGVRNYNRMMSFRLYFDTVDEPLNYRPIGSFHTVPVVEDQTGVAMRITDASGPLGSRVRSIRFLFTEAPTRHTTQYNEIGIYGFPSL